MMGPSKGKGRAIALRTKSKTAPSPMSRGAQRPGLNAARTRLWENTAGAPNSTRGARALPGACLAFDPIGTWKAERAGSPVSCFERLTYSSHEFYRWHLSLRPRLLLRRKAPSFRLALRKQCHWKRPGQRSTPRSARWLVHSSRSTSCWAQGRFYSLPTNLTPPGRKSLAFFSLSGAS